MFYYWFFQVAKFLFVMKCDIKYLSGRIIFIKKGKILTLGFTCQSIFTFICSSNFLVIIKFNG